MSMRKGAPLLIIHYGTSHLLRRQRQCTRRRFREAHYHTQTHLSLPLSIVFISWRHMVRRHNLALKWGKKSFGKLELPPSCGERTIYVPFNNHFNRQLNFFLDHEINAFFIKKHGQEIKKHYDSRNLQLVILNTHFSTDVRKKAHKSKIIFLDSNQIQTLFK